MPQRTYGSQRHRSAISAPLVTVGILLLGIIGGALILHAAGVVQIPFLAKKAEAPPPPDRTGLVPVPYSTRAIPAYAKVEREHILDRQGRVAVFWLRPEDVEKNGLLTEAQAQDLLLGRVLRREKPAGYAFRESEFYPKGTKPGPTAGVPPAMRAMRLKASDIPGLHGLNQGDRFDLVMTVEVEVEEPPVRAARAPNRGVDVDGPYAGLAENPPPPPEPAARVKRRQAEVRTIVKDGIVVQPVETRKEIGTKTSLLRGSSLTETPVEEIIIAVKPEEVADLNLALAVGAKLQVAMRSGQVSDDETQEGEIPDIPVSIDLPEPQPGQTSEGPGRVKLVEVIRGGVKHLMAVPIDQDDEPKPSTE